MTNVKRKNKVARNRQPITIMMLAIVLYQEQEIE